jgi:hypothetical protein
VFNFKKIENIFLNPSKWCGESRAARRRGASGGNSFLRRSLASWPSTLWRGPLYGLIRGYPDMPEEIYHMTYIALNLNNKKIIDF